MSMWNDGELDAAADRAEAALNGKYGDVYRQLRALSPEQLKEITPDTIDQKEYERLMALVQQASASNIDQAELVSRIKSLGATAINIAKQVKGLAAIL